MKKVELTCDKCKGAFECANSLDEYVCPYCGNKVVVEMSASKLGVKGAFAYFTRKNELKKERKQRELEAKIEAEKAKRHEQWKWFAALIGILAALAIVYLIAEAISPEEHPDESSSAEVSESVNESESGNERASDGDEAVVAASASSEAAQVVEKETDEDGYCIIHGKGEEQALSPGEKIRVTGELRVNPLIYDSHKRDYDGSNLYTRGDKRQCFAEVSGPDGSVFYFHNVDETSAALIAQYSASELEKATVTVRGKAGVQSYREERLYAGDDMYKGVALQAGAEIVEVILK